MNMLEIAANSVRRDAETLSLDRRIAKSVFGEGYLSCPPRYSTDQSCAWALLIALRDQRIEVTVCANTEGTWQVDLAGPHPEGDDYAESRQCGETFPIALCRAVLAFLDEQEACVE